MVVDGAGLVDFSNRISVANVLNLIGLQAFKFQLLKSQITLLHFESLLLHLQPRFGDILLERAVSDQQPRAMHAGGVGEREGRSSAAAGDWERVDGRLGWTQ